MMKVELEQHSGIRHDGVVVEFDQWQVFATGPDGNRVLVGYLSHDESLPIMMVCNQPDNVLKEIVEKCSAITGREVISPVPIVEPPAIDNAAGEDDIDDDQ
jgi:hypothetical protein